MKRIKKRRIAVIKAETAELFEIAINKKFDELIEYKLSLEIEHYQPNTAYIHYEYDEYIPESIADEFHLKGINYKCGDCNYCIQKQKKDGSIDNRSHKCFCSHHDRYVNMAMDACDVYYLEMVGKVGQFKPGFNMLPDISNQKNEDKGRQSREIVAKNLKILRVNKGVSMAKAAAEIGVAYQTYRSWEKAINNLRGDKLKAVADYYGCTVNEIIS